jgi:hypothetical protein
MIHEAWCLKQLSSRNLGRGSIPAAEVMAQKRPGQGNQFSAEVPGRQPDIFVTRYQPPVCSTPAAVKFDTGTG